MIYYLQPEDFSPSFSVAACYLLVGDEVLYLQREEHNTYPRCWGIPGGKVGEGEAMVEAVQREVYEETGIGEDLSSFQFQRTLYVRYPEYDFDYHVFFLKLPHKPRIHLAPREHRSFTWIKPLDALSLPLIPDEEGAVQYFFRLS